MNDQVQMLVIMYFTNEKGSDIFMQLMIELPYEIDGSLIENYEYFSIKKIYL
jgi:hypothetical protein